MFGSQTIRVPIRQNMATKKRTRKKEPKQSLSEQVLSNITRADVTGVVLILIAVFTLLSLMTGSRGSITAAWINALDRVFGIGAWAFPLLLSAVGLWLVIHAVERMPDMSWQRPVGVALLFVAFITGAALPFSPTEPYDGGWLGSQIAGLLEPAITAGGTWALVTLLSIAGIALLADRFIVESGLLIWDTVQDLALPASRSKDAADSSRRAASVGDHSPAQTHGGEHRRVLRSVPAQARHETGLFV